VLTGMQRFLELYFSICWHSTNALVAEAATLLDTAGSDTRLTSSQCHRPFNDLVAASLQNRLVTLTRP